MAEIIFITGGTRSGKSSFAYKLAEEKSTNPVCLATARIWDNDFKERVKRHQNYRGKKELNATKITGVIIGIRLKRKKILTKLLLEERPLCLIVLRSG
jgi:adenosylcobinamide kinase/adenosylcobinamide-phosphate guanylyltransferase